MSELTLNYTGIGSLPLKGEGAPEKSLDFIFENFKSMPFWPQLPHFAREEDMVFQFTQNLAGLTFEGDKYFLLPDGEEFFIKLEELFFDYETVTASQSLEECEEILEKYAILPPNSNTLAVFLERLKNYSPDFVKGSITGPFTFSTSLNDNEGKCAYYNDILKDVCIKTLSLKALWQVMRFKKAAPNARAVIFMDEPSISQVGSCAFLSVESKDVIEMLGIIAADLKNSAQSRAFTAAERQTGKLHSPAELISSTLTLTFMHRMLQILQMPHKSLFKTADISPLELFRHWIRKHLQRSILINWKKNSTTLLNVF